MVMRGGFPCHHPCLGETKVTHFGDHIEGHHDIGRLDILVHQPLFVSVVQPPGELDRHVQHAF